MGLNLDIFFLEFIESFYWLNLIKLYVNYLYFSVNFIFMGLKI